MKPSPTQIHHLANAAESRAGTYADRRSVDAMEKRGWIRVISRAPRSPHFEIADAGKILPDVIAELARREEARRPAREAAEAHNRAEESRRAAYNKWLSEQPPPLPPPPTATAPGPVLQNRIAEAFIEALGDTIQYDDDAMVAGQAIVAGLYDRAARDWLPSFLESKGQVDIAAKFRSMSRIVTAEDAGRAALLIRSEEIPLCNIEDDQGWASRNAAGKLKTLSFGASPNCQRGPIGTVHDMLTVVRYIAQLAIQTGHVSDAKWALMELGL